MSIYHFSLRHLQVIGKQNRKVPVILTQDMSAAVDTLIQYRKDCGILEANLYLFANQHLGHLNTNDALKAATRHLDLQRPELIRSTKLRKYMATVSQVCVMILFFKIGLVQ